MQELCWLHLAWLKMSKHNTAAILVMYLPHQTKRKDG